MNFIITVLAFLFTICSLVVFHELGHYWVARLCNVKVLRFSVGMGKVLYSRRFGPDQTEWVISALPVGGYVKMLDAREQGAGQIAPEERSREFTQMHVAKRIAIVAAGPLANFFLAIVLLTSLYMIGVPEPIAQVRAPAAGTPAYAAGLRAGDLVTAVNGTPIRLWSELRWKLVQLVLDRAPASVSEPVPASPTAGMESASASAVLTVSGAAGIRTVPLTLSGLSSKELESDFMARLGLSMARPPARMGHVLPDGPAFRAGLLEGDVITSIDGKAIPDAQSFIETIRAAPARTLQLAGMRGGAPMAWQVQSESTVLDGKLIGRISVEVAAVNAMVTVRDAFPLALQKAVERTWNTSILTVKMMGRMVLGQVSIKNITGPLTIADYAGQTAKIGWISYISFLAFISISLGVMNLLPIPVLDGGHLLYYSLEVLTGRPVSARFIELAQRAGFAMLILLMAVAFFNDIARLMPS